MPFWPPLTKPKSAVRPARKKPFSSARGEMLRLSPLRLSKKPSAGVCRPQAGNTIQSFTGTGYFDLVAYEKFHDGKMSNFVPSDEEISQSLAQLPEVH